MMPHLVRAALYNPSLPLLRRCPHRREAPAAEGGL